MSKKMVNPRRFNEECAGCFRHRRDEESVLSWHFWDMGDAGHRGMAQGAWLCPACKREQEKRVALFRGKSRAEMEEER